MVMKSTFFATAILIAATGAMAAQPAEQSTPAGETASTSPTAPTNVAETEAEPQEEKKICRTSKVTGSLTRRSRICMTEAQWREVNERTRRGVDEMASSASGSPTCISAQDVACNPSLQAPAGFAGGF